MRRKATAGLTLLEVLAAFLIFAMVFTVLVGSSQNAVQSQGLSVRRLQASEIADRALAELEIALAQGVMPELEEDAEQVFENFTLRVQESPMAPDEGASIAGPEPSPGAMVGEVSAASAVAMQIPEIAEFTQRYDIEVEWTEGGRQEKISRSTFAFDWTAAAIQFAALFPSSALAASGSTGSGSGSDADSASGSDGASGGDADSSASGSSGRESSSELERLKERACREFGVMCP